MSTYYNPVIVIGVKLKSRISEEVSCVEQRPARLKGVLAYDKKGKQITEPVDVKYIMFNKEHKVYFRWGYGPELDKFLSKYNMRVYAASHSGKTTTDHAVIGIGVKRLNNKPDCVQNLIAYVQVRLKALGIHEKPSVYAALYCS